MAIVKKGIKKYVQPEIMRFKTIIGSENLFYSYNSRHMIFKSEKAWKRKVLGMIFQGPVTQTWVYQCQTFGK